MKRRALSKLRATAVAPVHPDPITVPRAVRREAKRIRGDIMALCAMAYTAGVTDTVNTIRTLTRRR